MDVRPALTRRRLLMAAGHGSLAVTVVSLVGCGPAADDVAEALVSVAKLGALDFETLLVGHGAPIESGASAAVAALGAAG